ncbi:hypothetical protein ACFO3U_05570 [Flavobacterium ponti]|uniref:Uncharacterized protein n=1 Tax=Flavobacterium ponti TaxID=665133 RepID=A0ABV9P4C5_9FLAO
MKKIIFLSVFLLSMLTVAQENYEIIIMPKKFDFLREENQYNLNVLCKSFFEKEGYTVYYENDIMPNEVANNRCNALFLNLVENNSLFKTKVKVELKDCQNNLISFSEEGESREKNLSRAYNDATRYALKSMEGYTKFKNAYASTSDKKEKIEEIKSPQPEVIAAVSEKIPNENNTINSVLYSKIAKNGYNLVDVNGVVKFELFKTSNPTIFIAKKDNIQGIFTLNGQNSKFESYQNNELILEEVEVKF